MSLNIKNDETCRLAGELARLTSDTMTGAITVALRERLAQEKRRRDVDARTQELHAIGQRCATLVGEGPTSVGCTFSVPFTCQAQTSRSEEGCQSVSAGGLVCRTAKRRGGKLMYDRPLARSCALRSFTIESKSYLNRAACSCLIRRTSATMGSSLILHPPRVPPVYR